jgi:hypothetical protein
MSNPVTDAVNLEIVHLTAENQRLKAALAKLIPCAGRLPDGPAWASAKAKAVNRAMYEQAIDEACACFPDESVIRPDGTSESLSLRTEG